MSRRVGVGHSTRRRQNEVEVKTVTSQKYYQKCNITKKNGSTGGPCLSPVDKRAQEIHPDYHRRAHKTDVEYNGTPAGSRTGPMEATLRQYGTILPIVCGKRGEMNKETHDLVKELACKQAQDTFVDLGYDAPEDAVPVLARQMYLRWGCANVKAHALCLHSLLALDGEGTPVNEHQRRQGAFVENVRNQEEFHNQSQSCSPAPGRWAWR